MRKDELEAPATPPPASIPVICDTCRAAGHAGDPVFSAIPDILDFTPVPRRARVNNWEWIKQNARGIRSFICRMDQEDQKALRKSVERLSIQKREGRRLWAEWAMAELF